MSWILVEYEKYGWWVLEDDSTRSRGIMITHSNHSRGTYQPTSTIGWDRGIFHGSNCQGAFNSNTVAWRREDTCDNMKTYAYVFLVPLVWRCCPYFAMCFAWTTFTLSLRHVSIYNSPISTIFCTFGVRRSMSWIQVAPSFGRDWTAGSSKAVDWGFASGASVREVVKNHVGPLIYIYVYIHILAYWWLTGKHIAWHNRKWAKAPGEVQMDVSSGHPGRGR
jgi:hypothetical protein